MNVSPGRSRLTKYSSISPSIGPKRFLPTSRTLTSGASTMVPMFIRCWRAIRSDRDMHTALAIAEQLAPALIGRQRVTAILHEAQHVVEILARQCRVRRGSTHLLVHIVRRERRGTRQPQQVLRQHIQPAGSRRVAVQFARRDAQHGRLAFQHFEPVGRHQDRARRLIHPVIGATHALQQSGNTLRRADLDHLVHAAPVDAEIER